MANESVCVPSDRTEGVVLRSPLSYDLVVWLFTWGRERAFRRRLAGLARLQPGESVLDVGCGTGSLAVAAKRLVGPAGRVCGVDASGQMLARAARKAKRAGVDVAFEAGLAEALPFPDATFDAVFSTMMLHHLPPGAREQFAREARRVLKPGGRALAVDFGAAAPKRAFMSHHRPRHGRVGLDAMVAVLRSAGLDVVDSGAVGFRDLCFALATAPRA
jgi:ubiquinone/menaquinone biosynthesis C-methylase UbiE